MGFMDFFKKTQPRKNPVKKNPPLRKHVKQEPAEVILREMIEEHGIACVLEALAQEVLAAGEEQGLSEEDAEEVSVQLSELVEFCSGPDEDEDEDEEDDEDDESEEEDELEPDEED
ncbi:MAG: hypothetical protein QG602_413 [Verrucomicrobiota bacterium]|nr:hypothetical protein [Verrucomicrobiota bacterium]